MRLKHLKTRLALSSLLAVCALSGVATASASAAVHDFYVGGKAVGTAVSTAGTRGASKVSFEEYGVKMAFKCTGGSDTGTLEGEGLSTASGSLTGCGHLFTEETGKEVEQPGCTISNVGFGVKGKLIEAGKLTEEEFTPSGGTVYGTFAIEGSGCGLRKSPNDLEGGSLTCRLPEAGTEALLHEVSCSASGNSANHAEGYPFTIETVETVGLSGTSAGERWSANREYESETEHGFREEGKAVISAVTVAGTRGASTLSATMLGAGVKIKCTGGSSVGSIDGNTLSATETSLTGCKLFEVEASKETEQPNCAVGAIDLVSSDRLGAYGLALGTELFPSSKGVFANFAIKGASCAFKEGENKLEGAFACGLPSIGTEKVEHELSCGPHEGELGLKFDGEAATLEGTEALKLTGTWAGKQWSAK